MAIGDAYATAATYRARVVKSSADDDAAITSSLESVSRWLERTLNVVSFNQDAAAVARVYIGDGSPCLRVDEIALTAGLSIKVDEDDDGSFGDETALASSGAYELRPLNADKGPEAQPWREIVLPSWSSYGNAWPLDHRVEVTAVYGWPAVPEAIVNACIAFTAMVRGESPYFSGRILELDSVESVSPHARSVLNSLKDTYWMPVLA